MILPEDGVGFDKRLVEVYLAAKVLSYGPGGVLDLRTLREGEHYVKCQACGAKMVQLLPAHLRKCSGIDLQQYKERFPGAQVISAFGSAHRTKTEEQKLVQSEKLKARFKTPEGEETRRQIAEASKAMQAGEYGQRAAAHLRAVNSDPEQRAARGLETKARWDDGSQRKAVQEWQEAHPEEVAAGAANARRHLPQKDTKLHAKLRELLRGAGIQTVTEYEVGHYAIDEALPSRKIAFEADGCYFHGCEACGQPGLRENRILDKRKTTYLERRGWTVLRFPGCMIEKRPEECLRRVEIVWS